MNLFAFLSCKPAVVYPYRGRILKNHTGAFIAVAPISSYKAVTLVYISYAFCVLYVNNFSYFAVQDKFFERSEKFRKS